MITGASQISTATITDYLTSNDDDPFAEEKIKASVNKSNKKVAEFAYEEYIKNSSLQTIVHCPTALREAFNISNGNTKDELTRLLDAKNIQGESLLRKTEGVVHRPGYQFVLNVSKELSLARSLTDDEKFKNAFDQSLAEATNAVAKQTLGLLRHQNGSKNGQEKIDGAILFYKHNDTRAGDPHIHLHAIIPNIGIRDGGKFGAIEIKEFSQAVKEQWIGQLFQNELAFCLRKHGYEITGKEINADKNDTSKNENKKTYTVASMEIGMTPEQINIFSQRSEEIKKELEKSKVEATTKNKQIIADKQRGKKLKIDFEKEWRERAEVANVKITIDNNIKKLQKPENVGYAELLKHYQNGEVENITKGKIYNAVLKKCVGFDPSKTLSSLDKLIEKQIIEGQKYLNGEKIESGLVELKDGSFTTVQALDREKKYLCNINEMANSRKKEFTVSSDVLEEEISKYEFMKNRHKLPGETKFVLSEKQKCAIEVMTSGQLSVIEGIAGAGKSTIAEIAVNAYKQQGFNIIGLTPTGIASINLEESISSNSQNVNGNLNSTNSHTIDAFLMNTNLMDSVNNKTVLVIDEAGMCGMKTLAPLIEIAKTKGAKIIAIGDEQQLASIRFAGGFREMKEAVKSYCLLDENRRQDNAISAGKEVGELLREGKTEKVYKKLKENNVVNECSGNVEAIKKTVQLFIDSKHKDDEKIILTETNDVVNSINKEIREYKIQSGQINKKIEYQVDEKKETYYEGERIIFGKNTSISNSVFKSENGQKVAIKNSMMGTIKEVSIDLKGNPIIVVDIGKNGNERLVRFNPKEYKEFSLGYAITKHKCQGATFKDVVELTVGSRVHSKSTGYVAITRHKNKFSLVGTQENLKKWIEYGKKKPDLRTLQEKIKGSEVKERKAKAINTIDEVKEWKKELGINAKIRMNIDEKNTGKTLISNDIRNAINQVEEVKKEQKTMPQKVDVNSRIDNYRKEINQQRKSIAPARAPAPGRGLSM